jgi:hypothetical protein
MIQASSAPDPNPQSIDAWIRICIANADNSEGIKKAKMKEKTKPQESI